jgi:hypothetical protein
MVTGMRKFRRLLRSGVALRRPAAAWLTLATLFALCLSQPFHASAPLGSSASSPAVRVVAAGSELPSQRAAHDADLCSVCRATAQVRLGVRVMACVGELATTGATLPLHLPAPALASAAPTLRNAQPRAPPATLLVLSA